MIDYKFIYKYMRLARQIAEDNSSCYSRKIGAVIAKEEGNTSRILGTGYNGPPSHIPHTDSEEFLMNYVWPQLNGTDKTRIAHLLSVDSIQDDNSLRDLFIKKYVGQKMCPRKILQIPSGQGLSLCAAIHAELNSILNAKQSVCGAEMFCWCPVPCTKCAGQIVQVGIKVVHCLDEEPYAGVEQSLWLFNKGGVEVKKYKRENFDKPYDEWKSIEEVKQENVCGRFEVLDNITIYGGKRKTGTEWRIGGGNRPGTGWRES